MLTRKYNIKAKSVLFLDTIVSINESGYIEADVYWKSISATQLLSSFIFNQKMLLSALYTVY